MNGTKVTPLENNGSGNVEISPREFVENRKKYEEEEEKFVPEHRNIAVTSLQDDEEEMLRRAIDESLREYRIKTGEEIPYEEQKIIRKKPIVPPIQIHETESEPNEPEKVKTPSTGEATPTRLFRLKLLEQQKQMAALNLQPNGYQILAKNIENQNISSSERKREFEEKFELAELASHGNRIKLKQKSNAAILKALLKLEEETNGGLPENIKKKPAPKSRKRMDEDFS